MEFVKQVEVNIDYILMLVAKYHESNCTDTQKIRVTASDGKKYNTNFYSLDAIIAVGYRVIQDKNYISDFDELVAKTKKIDKTNINLERQIYGKLAQSIKNKNKKESE
jgi:type I restriction enzyme R subunit